MKLPKLDDLIPEQTDVYIHAENKDLFVAGPPGSGKTTLAVLRGNYLRNHGLSVLLITRNRMLAALGRDLGDGTLDTSTMHSAVASAYYSRFKQNIPKAWGPYDFDWNKALATYAANKANPSYDHLVIDEGQNLPPEFFSWAKQYGGKTLTVFADEDQTTDSHRSSGRNTIR